MLRTAIALKVKVSFTNSDCDHDHLKLNFLSYGNQILGISFQLVTLQWKEWKDNDLAKTGLTKEFDRWSGFFLWSWCGECQIHIESFRLGLHRPFDLMSTLDVLTDILNGCFGHPLCKFSIVVPPCADNSWIWGFENQKCAQSTTNVRWPLFTITGTTVGTIVA